MNPKIRESCAFPRLLNAQHFNMVIRFAQPCGIKQRDRKTAQINPQLDHIAGRPGDIGNQGNIPACNPIQQTGFTGVWRSNDRNFESGPDALGRRKSVNLNGKFVPQSRKKCKNLVRNIIWNVFVSKIHAGLDKRAGANQQTSPGFGLSAQLSSSSFRGQFPLFFCFGLQKIAKPLDFGQIHTAVKKCPARKFAGLCLPRVELRQR